MADHVPVDDRSWDYSDPASKPRVLEALQRNADDVFAVIAPAERWNAPTACAGWEVRDMVGHLVDALESFLAGFAHARDGTAPPEPIGAAGMADATDLAARAFRDQPREVLVARLHTRHDELMQEFEALSDADWSQLLVHDKYLGPLPAMIVVEGLLGGYAVHTWDIFQGLGQRHSLRADTADLLVPFVFLLWSVTAQPEPESESFAIGIRTSGRNGRDVRADVDAAGIRFADASVDDCRTIVEVDPGTLVLTAYGRVNAGTVHGDPSDAARFLSRFGSL
jgi:uncharacterized protein (TIGR03083 family)